MQWRSFKVTWKKNSFFSHDFITSQHYIVLHDSHNRETENMNSYVRCPEISDSRFSFIWAD